MVLVVRHTTGTVATLKADIQAWHASGTVTAKLSLRVLRKRWNTVMGDVRHRKTGAAWFRMLKRGLRRGKRGCVLELADLPAPVNARCKTGRLPFQTQRPRPGSSVVTTELVREPDAATSTLCRSSGPSARTVNNGRI